MSTSFVIFLAMCVFGMLKKGLRVDANNLRLGAISKAERRKARALGAMEIESSTKPRRSETSSDVAWKKLSGQVFRAPAYPAIFSCMLGAGAQVFLMSYLVLNAFVFFFTIESLRPPIFYIIMTVLALMGFVNGLITMRTLKFFGLTDWIFSAAVSSVTLPAFIYLVFGIELILKVLSGGYTKDNLLY